MAVSCVGYILNCLKKDSLVSICQERGLSLSGNKPTLHHRLRSSFGRKPIELLSFLSKKELTLICKKSELPIYGNIEQLIDRIMSLDLCENYHMFDSENDYSDDESYSEEDFDEISEDSSSNLSFSTPEFDNSKSDFESELPKKYDFIGPIGKGGFGEAFLCKDKQLKRKVIIKRPHPNHEDQIMVEARIQAKFQHQNIVSIYDIQTSSAFPFIVMEYCSQGSLWDRIKATGYLKDYEVKTLVRGVANGLREIHQKNITHKDLGPHNIFFDSNGSAKIGDFGIAEVEGFNSGGFHRLFRAPESQENRTCSYDLYTLGQTMVTCWKGIPSDPYSQTDIPEKSTVDAFLWFLAWLLLSENPRKRPSTDDIVKAM